MPEPPTTPHRFRYLLFDLGGTLIYFDDEWSVVLRQSITAGMRSLRSFGYALDEDVFPDAYLNLMREFYQRRSDEELEYTAAFVLSESLRRHGHPEPREEHVRQALRSLYAVSQAHWHVEEDAAPMLAAQVQAGCRLGIVSNASDDEDVQTLVDNAGLRQYFDFILTSAAAGYRKPSPLIFRQALDFWGADASQAVMIGDTVNADIAGANRCQIASVWITRRADTLENHAAARQFPPGRTIKTLSELPAALAGWKDE